MSFIRQNSALILASTSPYRKMILEDAGLVISAHCPLDDEEDLKSKISHLPFDEQANKLAIHKGQKLSENFPNSYIICGDQIAVCDGKPYSKAGSIEKSISNLMNMAGQKVELFTAVCLMNKGKVIWSTVEIPYAIYRDLSQQEIESYVAAEDVTQVAGSCKLEGLGKHLLRSFHGERSTVIGLPIVPLLNELYRLKLLEIV